MRSLVLSAIAASIFFFTHNAFAQDRYCSGSCDDYITDENYRDIEPQLPDESGFGNDTMVGGPLYVDEPAYRMSRYGEFVQKEFGQKDGVFTRAGTNAVKIEACGGTKADVATVKSFNPRYFRTHLQDAPSFAAPQARNAAVAGSRKGSMYVAACGFAMTWCQTMRTGTRVGTCKILTQTNW